MNNLLVKGINVLIAAWMLALIFTQIVSFIAGDDNDIFHKDTYTLEQYGPT